MHKQNTRWDKDGRDPATAQLLTHGNHSAAHAPAHSWDTPPEHVKPNRGIWAGIKITAILSLLLFWLAPFGQMIAGYIGGRKAGSTAKGLVATIFPLIVVLLVFIVIRDGAYSTQVDRVSDALNSGLEFATTKIPVISPYLNFIAEYFRMFAETFRLSLGGYNIYLITVVFGIIGGHAEANKAPKSHSPVAVAHPNQAIVLTPEEEESLPVATPVHRELTEEEKVLQAEIKARNEK